MPRGSEANSYSKPTERTRATCDMRGHAERVDMRGAWACEAHGGACGIEKDPHKRALKNESIAAKRLVANEDHARLHAADAHALAGRCRMYHLTAADVDAGMA